MLYPLVVRKRFWLEGIKVRCPGGANHTQKHENTKRTKIIEIANKRGFEGIAARNAAKIVGCSACYFGQIAKQENIKYDKGKHYL